MEERHFGSREVDTDLGVISVVSENLTARRGSA